MIYSSMITVKIVTCRTLWRERDREREKQQMLIEFCTMNDLKREKEMGG
jgi:hypothetical protein